MGNGNAHRMGRDAGTSGTTSWMSPSSRPRRPGGLTPRRTSSPRTSQPSRGGGPALPACPPAPTCLALPARAVLACTPPPLLHSSPHPHAGMIATRCLDPASWPLRSCCYGWRRCNHCCLRSQVCECLTPHLSPFPLPTHGAQRELNHAVSDLSAEGEIRQGAIRRQERLL